MLSLANVTKQASAGLLTVCRMGSRNAILGRIRLALSLVEIANSQWGWGWKQQSAPVGSCVRRRDSIYKNLVACRRNSRKG